MSNPRITDVQPTLSMHNCFNYLYFRFYLFLLRETGGGREKRGKEALIGLSYASQPGTEPAYQTGEPSLCRMTSNQLSQGCTTILYRSQAYIKGLLNQYAISTIHLICFYRTIISNNLTEQFISIYTKYFNVK